MQRHPEDEIPGQARSASSGAEPMIELEDFSFRYGDGEPNVLDRISLSAQRGEFLGVAGAEASGRTTLFRVLNGSAFSHFHGMHEGLVRVGGLDARSAGHVRIGAFTASIYGDPDAQIVNLTVEDEVGFALVQRGLPAADVARRVSEALESVGLAGFQRRATASLSGGQKQRLVAATAFALEPRIILLDECASALDPKGARGLYAVVKDFCSRRSVTVVAIERDLELLADVADKIAIMETGYVADIVRPSALASRVPLLRRAGLRVPAWMSLSARLGFGISSDFPYPRNEGEAVQMLREMAG